MNDKNIIQIFTYFHLAYIFYAGAADLWPYLSIYIRENLTQLCELFSDGKTETLLNSRNAFRVSYES